MRIMKSSHPCFYSQKKQGKWNILNAFSTSEEDLGSTDASTRESAEQQDPAATDGTQPSEEPAAHFSPSDNHSIGSSSFPLLSTNAKQGLSEKPSRESPIHPYSGYRGPHQHDNMPHLEVVSEQEGRSTVRPYLQHLPELHDQLQAAPHHQPREQHMDIYQRQHGEELQQLEHHLRYLQEQHQQLEHEIHERQRMQQEQENGGDYRPRSVRFAAQIARNLEEVPQDEPDANNTSPTSVTNFDENVNDQNVSKNSVIEPKVLFGAGMKPKSILRNSRRSVPLDERARYSAGYRSRTIAPIFTDSNGREVSPIRSPGPPRTQHAAVYEMETPQTGDVVSVPDNPDDKDIAVLFDSDADVDIEMVRREVSSYFRFIILFCPFDALVDAEFHFCFACCSLMKILASSRMLLLKLLLQLFCKLQFAAFWLFASLIGCGCSSSRTLVGAKLVKINRAAAHPCKSKEASLHRLPSIPNSVTSRPQA
jgi:hypothetical protein